MKFTKQEFLQSPQMHISIDETMHFSDSGLLADTPVRDIPEVVVEGLVSYDGKKLVTTDLKLHGFMVVGDSITDEDLEVEFETVSQQTYSFVPLENKDLEEDIVPARQDTVDLDPEILQAVLYEAPMALTRLDREDYPAGNGWKLISDQDRPGPVVDPRWEKLNDFKFDDDE